MQHVRKLVLIFSIVIFVAVTAIGTGMIFAVRNVNVTLLSYTYESDGDGAKAEIAQIKQKVLQKYRGNTISSITEEKVAEVLRDGLYTIEKFEKIYPCTLELTLKERRETYAELYSEGIYRIYDEKGIYLKDADENVNSVDGASNVLLEGVAGAEEILYMAEIGEIFSVRFGAMRSVTDKIVFDKAQSVLEKDKVLFVLRCGVGIEIRDYKNMTAGKIDAAFHKYTGLSGEQKLQGRIYCTATVDGNIVASYSSNA